MPDCEYCKKVDIDGPIDGGVGAMVWYFLNEIVEVSGLVRVAFYLIAFLVGFGGEYERGWDRRG